MTPDLLQLIRDRKAAHRKWTKSGDKEQLRIFRRLRTRSNNLYRRLRNEYNFDACLAFRHKPQRLWNVINTTTGRVLPQQPVPTPAETSNSYFHHFVHDIGATYDIPFGPHQPGDLDKFREVTQETVVKPLRNLDPSKAPGPDGMLPSVLRECSQFLAPSLAKVFNSSLQSGRVPDAWKMANITPLFKAGKDGRFSPASYRGI